MHHICYFCLLNKKISKLIIKIASKSTSCSLQFKLGGRYIHLFKNKLLFISPLVVLLVITLFGLTLIPSVQQNPENLPIALGNEDIDVIIPQQGKVNMRETITNMVKEQTTSTDGEEPVVKWINVNSEEEVLKGLDNQEYYGALIIPKGFSQK